MPAGRRASDTKTIFALCLTVKDEGIGIPEDELESIFDTFVQSSITKAGYGGTGLGLAICKEIVLAHRGRIWAENRQKEGVVLSFALPYNQEAAQVY